MWEGQERMEKNTGGIRFKCEKEFNEQNLKAICRFSAIPYQNPNDFFHRNRKMKSPKIVSNHNRPQTTKLILRK